MKNIFLIFITIIISIFSLFKDTSSVFADWNNLIQNNDFEISNLNSPQGWFIGWWGKNISNFTYPVEWYLSNNAVKVEIKTYSDGDAKWYFEDVPVIPGWDYVFSDMYNSNVDTSIVARYKLSNWTYIYKYLWLVPTSSSWKEFKIDFTTPQDVVSLTIFHIINKVWFLVIDNVTLTTQNNSFSEWMISFSFDDGFKNIYDLAIPILDNAGIKSTQAVMTSSFNYPMYMSKEEVKKLYDNWHEIASHTMNHVNLTQVSIETAIEEISKSKSDLLDIWINVTSFVYPYGAYNNQTINILKESWYLWARSVFQWFNTPNSDKFQLKDMHVDGNATWENIKLWIDKAINEKKWLILEFHQQGENLWYYSNTTEFLQKIVDYVVEKKVKTITIAQWIEMIN